MTEKKGESVKIPHPNPPGSLGSALEEVDEPKAKCERKKVPIGIFEAVTIPQHGVVYKSVKDQTGKDLTFKDSKDADKWLAENAKEGDNDKVYLIAPRRLVTVRAKRQLKISVER